MGSRWGVGFVRGRDQLLQRHAARLLFEGTGHAREGATLECGLAQAMVLG